MKDCLLRFVKEKKEFLKKFSKMIFFLRYEKRKYK